MIRTVIGIAAMMATASGRPITLSEMNIDPSGVSVSGLSAGAFMAVQMHVAYSSTINGSAIFAGGPFYCAQDSLMIAEGIDRALVCVLLISSYI